MNVVGALTVYAGYLFSVIERNLVPVPKTTIVSKDQPIETSMTQEMAQKAKKEEREEKLVSISNEQLKAFVF